MEQYIPKHVAIIMDGNRRWAERRGLSRVEGHRAGANTALNIIRYLDSKGISYVTLYSFSTENWSRPADEVKELMQMLEQYVTRESNKLDKMGFRIKHIGRMNRLSPKLAKAIDRALEKTRTNTGITVNLAFDYGGRTEIVDAIKKLVADEVPAENIDEPLFSNYLYTAGMPDVDLLVRTGGELRLSNFLMWQLAYSELFFTPVLWPDFNQEEMAAALSAFKSRERRFGGD
ncbi:MAG: polyprenyl diphosphate synthase [Dehalococcoidales bacterium]|jgi:undecaprenyl diphosphate synthase|nr:polyprenyl diphosphate synthase [Dehalococcoidales bacterium]MDD5604800.1 polyprenyl diphosphate synthase [Dehalococcoidales bacterium]NLE89659.1 di-trans,poly-cis-decaprenylcistransferase [Dehalococcoidales bacterium]